MPGSSILYNPHPPRVWSRVQNTFSTTQNDIHTPNVIVYIPLTNQYVTPAQAQLQAQMLQKGNILQYKNNSANLTKNQKYSRISQGFANTRRKTYATQSETYSNPNTSSLLRVNYTNVPYPNDIVGEPNNPSGPFQPNVVNPFDCSSNVLQDGGNLVCNAIVNPCTGQIIEKFQSYQKCYPSSCSDVPGAPTELCWYPGIQTWYPRNRYTMNNSLDKWPEGYKGFVSAVTPAPPTLTLSTNQTNTDITLSWTTIACNTLSISNYGIYQNGTLIDIVPYTTTTLTIPNLRPYETYAFYVVAVNGSLNSKIHVSPPSNTMSVYFVPNNTGTGTGTGTGGVPTNNGGGTGGVPNPNGNGGGTGGVPNPNGNGGGTGGVPSGNGNGQVNNIGNVYDVYLTNTSDNTITKEGRVAYTVDSWHIIIETPPTNNTITLPQNITKYHTISVYNRSNVEITVQSIYKIYNHLYSPNGTNAFVININQTSIFTYVHTANDITVHATLN